MFADREVPIARPVDLGALTWYCHSEEIIDIWAKQLMELANTPDDHVVKDSSSFTLKPW